MCSLTYSWCCDDVYPTDGAAAVPLPAPADPIRSQFRLTFFMLLNMLSSGRNAASVVWNSFALWGQRSPGELRDRLER